MYAAVSNWTPLSPSCIRAVKCVKINIYLQEVNIVALTFLIIITAGRERRAEKANHKCKHIFMTDAHCAFVLLVVILLLQCILYRLDAVTWALSIV